MREIVGYIASAAFVAFLLFVLGAIIRFSIISRHKTKNARARLRHPDPEAVEGLCGFAPPPELVAMHTSAPFVELVEFYLIDRSTKPPRSWFIGGFIPLTAKDVSEHRKISGMLEGIPIADDLTKGTYYVNRGGSVMLRTPNRRGPDLQVARDVNELASFEVSQSEATAVLTR
jgi:hypothetical protein